uniref:Integrase catalytic domain-containing protein n=1 Tax=Plectus sambesii TaxID=2011161 RepID=A0A914X1K7_9BILA
MWFIVMDAHSKWPEIVQMKIGETLSSHVIAALMGLFSRYGLAEELISDNGKQFTSDEFESWCAHNGIKHSLTTPYHPQSKGLAKRFVATFKQAMLKSAGEEEAKETRLLKFLQRYRVTPHPATDQAPAELFLKRTPRSQFDLLFPMGMHAMEKARMQAKIHFDQHVKPKSLYIGATVYIRNYRDKKKWLQGSIVDCHSDVMWKVKADSRSNIWMRHADQLRLAAASDNSTPDTTDVATSERSESLPNNDHPDSIEDQLQMNDTQPPINSPMLVPNGKEMALHALPQVARSLSPPAARVRPARALRPLPRFSHLK